MQERDITGPYPPSFSPPTATFSVDGLLLRMLRGLRQRWLLTALVFVALFLPMAIVAMQEPNLYRAEAKILLENDARIALELSTALASRDRERTLPLEKLNSQAELIKSTTLLQDLIRRLGLADTEQEEQEQLARLQREISVRVIPTSSVISVSYADPEPQRARDVVNTLMDVYKGYYLRLVEGENPVQLYQIQYAFSDAALKEDMQAYRALQDELGITSRYEVEQKRLSGKLAELESELSGVQMALEKTERKQSILQQQLTATPETINASRDTIPNPEALQLSEDLSRLLAQRESLMTRYTAKHTEVRQKDTEIDALRSRRHQIPEYITGESSYVANPQYNRLQAQFSEAQIESAQQRLASERLKRDMSDTRDKLLRLEGEAFRLTSLEDSIDGNQKARRLYHSKLTDARFIDTMNRENILSANIIESAITVQSSNARIKTIGASFVLAVIVALGVMLLLELRTPRVRNADELRALLGVPALATMSDASKERLMLGQQGANPASSV